MTEPVPSAIDNGAPVIVNLPKFKVSLSFNKSSWNADFDRTLKHILPFEKYLRAYFETSSCMSNDLMEQMRGLGNEFRARYEYSKRDPEELTKFLIEAIPDQNVMLLRSYGVAFVEVVSNEEVHRAYVKSWMALNSFMNMNNLDAATV